MIIGIQPRTTAFKEEVYQTFIPYDWANRGTGGAVKSLGDGASTSSDTVSSAKNFAPSVVTSKSPMYFNVTRNSYESKQTKFAPVLTRNGVIHFFGGTYTQSVSGYPGINEWNLYHPFQKVPTGLDDGVYDIRMAYWDENGKAHLCPFPKQITPTLEIVNGGTGMIFRGLEGDDYEDKLVIENITPASEVYAERPSTYTLQAGALPKVPNCCLKTWRQIRSTDIILAQAARTRSLSFISITTIPRRMPESSFLKIWTMDSPCQLAVIR